MPDFNADEVLEVCEIPLGVIMKACLGAASSKENVSRLAFDISNFLSGSRHESADILGALTSLIIQGFSEEATNALKLRRDQR